MGACRLALRCRSMNVDEDPVPILMETVAEPAWPRARLNAWIYFAAGVLAVALIFRYAMIEPHWIGIACGSDDVPWWCDIRQGIVMMHVYMAWGLLGLAGGALSFIFGWLWAVRLGLAMSLMGLVLYNADYASIGLLLTLLRLPRL